MRQELFDNNYIILEEFVPRDHARSLAEKFKVDCERENLPGDAQAENSHSIYNYKPALEILCNSTNRVSEVIDEPVLPTYTYARVYKQGSVLTKHTDRPSCEISLTIHLGGDKPWPIWIKNKEDKNVCAELQPGDALLYLGCIAPHWRDEFFGTWYAQMFMHYVRSNGPAAEYYFDKLHPTDIDKRHEQRIQTALHHEHETGERPLTNQYLNGMLVSNNDSSAIDWDSNKNDEDNEMKTNILDILEQKKQNLQRKKSGLMNRLIKEKEQTETKLIKLSEEMSTSQKDSVFVRFNEREKPKQQSSGVPTLDHFVRVYENVLPDRVCDDILNEYVTTDLWSQAMTGGGADDTARNCDVIGISNRNILEQSPNIRTMIDKSLFNCVATLIKKYESDCAGKEGLSIAQDTGYELLRYREGQFYIQHTDHFKENPRVVSCSICLNDDYEGGEFAFFDRNKVIKPKKGSAIMFPSSFMFPHEVMPVIRGNRYAIITWLV